MSETVIDIAVCDGGSLNIPFPPDSVGRPSYKPVVWYKSFLYQAASWTRARRVVAKVEFHFGELFPRVGFIVTNLVALGCRIAASQVE